MSFTVYPSVDIAGGRCIRPLQGRFGNESIYSDDPVKVAVGLSRAGARWLHIVDLEGARSGEARNREVVVEAVKRAACPVQAGGGVRSIEDVEELLFAGANRAVLGTKALDDRAALGKTCARYGERIVVSLDARGNELDPGGWTVGQGTPVLDAVKIFAEAGVSMFVYTDTTRDGSLAGPDTEGLLRIAGVTDRPVVASGGIGSLEEVRTVARLRPEGVAGAIVGRALFENKFSVGEAQFVADEAAAGRDEPPLVES